MGCVNKPLILILCTGNCCRSQMAEAILRGVVGEAATVASAGAIPTGYVHPAAIATMAERGFDLSGAKSKHMDEFLERRVDIVITVCRAADEACPEFPGRGKRYHWPFKDPIMVVGTDEMVAAAFRKVRNEMEVMIGAYGRGLVDGLGMGG